MLGSFEFALHECLIDDHLRGDIGEFTSPSSHRFRIESKLRCLRSTPTEMQSIRENDFECLASTGVNTPEATSPSLCCSVLLRFSNWRMGIPRGASVGLRSGRTRIYNDPLNKSVYLQRHRGPIQSSKILCEPRITRNFCTGQVCSAFVTTYTGRGQEFATWVPFQSAY